MLLKSVEIHGFKSFANKMVLSFGSGITGIVGPNGSGKSNVADAVRWVLGEQSAKQLRGAKMEDVIFAGTKIRKAQSFAYVALTLDNSDKLIPIDYEEVVVARRVYRSGESEYLINGSKCRLKDVQDLFLDTGIGKEGYSIIGQGQIEKILSGKPEDRRELFDEASGITKFKKRKATAIKNLEEEAANLERVSDILKELERQVLPLKEQSEKAKLYLSYRDELKKYETTHFVNEYDKSEDVRQKITRDQEIAESSMKSVMDELDRSKAVYEEVETKLANHNHFLEDLSNSISEKKLEREKAEGSIKVILEKLNSAKQNHENFHERLTKEEEKLELVLREKENKEGERIKLLQEEELFTKELSDLKNLSNQYLEKKKNLEKEKILRQEEGIRFEKEKAEAGGLISLYSTNVEQINIKRLEINQKILRNKESFSLLKEKLDKSEKSIKTISEDIEEIRLTLDSAVSLVASLKLKKTDKEKFYKEKEKEIITLKTVLASMKNTAMRYEGYGSSVKHIMERKNEEAGIIGVVADIIKVKENYELAIETAMGGSIQNIVTDKEETAKRTIAFLKERKFGRATFLPLDAIGLHNPGNFGGALNEKGIIGVASSLVEFEPKYAGIVSHILGKTLIADTLDTAVKIARKYRYTLRIVTLEGEQLNPGGALTGGAYRNSNHLLGRTREIEEKEKDLEKLEKELKEITEEGQSLAHAISENKKSIEIYKSRLSDLRIQKNTEENAKKQHEERMEELDKLSSEIWLDADHLDLEKENALSEIERLNGILNSEGKGSEASVKAIERELLDLEEKISSVNEDYNSKNLQLASLTSGLGFLEKERERLEKEESSVQNEIVGLNENYKNYETFLTDNEALLSNIKKQIADFTSKIEKEEEEKLSYTRERDDLVKESKELVKEREGLSDRKNQLEKEMIRLSNSLEKIEDSITDLINYMNEKYGLTYSEIMKTYVKEDISSFALNKLILKQKSLIKELGTVNVNAIEEYKEVSERYELLKVQHEDIEEAEKILRNIIEELDKKMREKFNKSFKDINDSFNKTFSELFGGGSGKLLLMEGEDMLEAGIKIIAEPPGKKLQNMMQLSGGEKSLTAIALLFAIQNLKPSPFCLLDEIEAALDDSNVVRFADYLHRLTKDTQFIVITHRRGTMNAADMLYGITMQEKGISTMVSVNLIEAELSN